MERYLLELDILRRKAEARIAMGGACPGGSVSILWMQNAPLSRNENPLLLASVRGPWDFPIAAKQMCRFCALCGAPARQDVLTATDMEAKSGEEDLSYEAWAAYREAEKMGGPREG